MTATSFHCWLRRIFSLGVICLFSACQTARESIPAPVGGRTFSGQVQYSGPARSFVGEFTAISSSTAFQLVISKGLPLISVQQADDRARLEFAGRAWQGSIRRAPAPTRTWLALPEVFAQLSAVKREHFPSQTPGLWNADVEFVGSRAKFLRVTFPATSERLAFAFSKPSAVLTDTPLRK